MTADRLDHYVSTAPFDPHAIEHMSAAQERYYMASQWRMMWWKLKRHRIAAPAGVVLLAMYLSITVSDFLSPYGSHSRHADFIIAPPQSVHLFPASRLGDPFLHGYD